MHRYRLPEESFLIFEQIIEHSSNAIFIVDGGLTLTFANHPGERLYHHLLATGQLAKTLTEDCPQLDLSTADAPLWLRTRCVDISKPQGTPGQLLIATDITGEVQAQREESLSRWRLEQTLELTEEGFWLWDVSSGIISHNQDWNRLFGFDDNRLTHHQDAMFNLIHPDDIAATRQHFQNHLSGQTPLFHCEYRVVDRVGRQRWILNHGKAVRHSDSGTVLEMLGKAKDITEKKRREREMLQLAWQDPLTQLDNRNRFYDKVEQARGQMDRHQFSALLYLDLTRFKEVNDTLGHNAGDELLKIIAQRLRSTLRSHDAISRLGGDEFAVLVTDLGDSYQEARNKLTLLAERLLQNLEQDAIIGDNQLNITSSIGIYLYRHDLAPIAEMMHKADMAQYYSKKNHRKWMFWSTRLREEQRQRDTIENGLRRALKEDEFFLEYQPQFSRCGSVTGLEALLRWRTPDGRLISPATFIPVAENSGLILNISEWVLERTCAQLKQWQTQPGMETVRVSVNISPRQLKRSDFIRQTERIVSRSGVDPQRLSFEILESALASDIDDVQRKLSALRDMRINIALDNFGTGMASLTGLRKLGIGEVKIDRSFVMDMERNPDHLMAIRAMIAMCQALGINIVAEGVEEETQFSALCEMGCHRFQGWYFSRSQTPDRLVHLFN
ncbi:EAL domain-containing protein [Erwinia sp. S43]|uniref:putative bifunctional diguanylate cyclase/phosphodiesterase n=1 Tax=Erwinia sp. S43 TaxID=2769339 RepID=UPI00190B0D36|nr:bifunctional diguanylate cyclase/phosphodiesterase [Erwinia sp. S43]MBK0032775.1 EAL domain-containing protein [Erwinia sp. S43]